LLKPREEGNKKPNQNKQTKKTKTKQPQHSQDKKKFAYSVAAANKDQ